MAKKYVVEYATNGYGWTKEYNRLEEFEAFIDENRREIYASISVWDATGKSFIFLKRILTHTPEIDMLHNVVRDMRTTTKKAKGV